MSQPNQTYKPPVFKVAEPITVRRLIAELESMVGMRPDIEDWPVHILDMGDGYDVAQESEDGKECLVTTVQIDKFSEKQGWVVSLCAERMTRDWSKG